MILSPFLVNFVMILGRPNLQNRRFGYPSNCIGVAELPLATPDIRPCLPPTLAEKYLGDDCQNRPLTPIFRKNGYVKS